MAGGFAGAEDAAGSFAQRAARDADGRPERRGAGAARRARAALGRAARGRGFSGAARHLRRRRHGAGLLDLAGLPYVGSGVLGSAVGMDKDMQKRLFLQAGLPVGDFLAVPRSEWEKARAKVSCAGAQEVPLSGVREAGDAGLVGGHDQGARRQGIAAAIDLAAEFAQKIVVERNIHGREIEVAVLGNDDPEASMPGEIMPHREFYDYAAKYLEDGTRLEIPAKLTQGAGEAIPGICHARLPLPGIPRHGARGFFPGAAAPAALTERSEHHSRLHVDQHVPEAVGSSGVPYRN